MRSQRTYTCAASNAPIDLALLLMGVSPQLRSYLSYAVRKRTEAQRKSEKVRLRSETKTEPRIFHRHYSSESVSTPPSTKTNPYGQFVSHLTEIRPPIVQVDPLAVRSFTSQFYFLTDFITNKFYFIVIRKNNRYWEW